VLCAVTIMSSADLRSLSICLVCGCMCISSICVCVLGALVSGRSVCSQTFGAESLVFQFAIKNSKIKIYRNRIVLYGCGTQSLTLREECWPRVLGNRVLKRIFGPKRDEVTGEWRKL